MRNSIQYISILHFVSALLFCQEIPSEFYIYETKKLVIDSGKNWKENTAFNPIRHALQYNDSLLSNEKFLKIDLRYGLLTKNSDMSFYFHLHSRFNKYFYVYLYPRFVNNQNAFPRFSGLKRDISRFGFNAGETDLAGIGFENGWSIIQFGRGRQGWGAGLDNQVTLNENSNAYDYGMLGLNFSNFKSRYFHGWLERIDSTNRYIVAKGIEWTNKRNLILNISEIVIYSGVNRSIDIAYLNPVSSHLEIELNNRQNVLGNSSANAIWQFSLDILANNNLRLSANYIIDELILDKIEEKNGKENGLGGSLKLAWTPYDDKKTMTIFLSYTKIGTHTLKHENGFNNFVHRGSPIGYQFGNDVQQINTGFNLFQKNKFILSSNIGYRELGENSVLKTPYISNEHHQKGKFPSGEIEEVIFCNFRIRQLIKDNFSIISNFNWSNSNIFGQHSSFNIGADYYFNLTTNLK